MTDVQLFLVAGLPTGAVLIGILINAVMMLKLLGTSLNARMTSLENRMARLEERLEHR
jgi:hypothetical protein